MLKGISKGLGAAVSLMFACNLLMNKPIEIYYSDGIKEVFGMDVTLGSFFVLFAIAGAISEVLEHVTTWFKYAYYTKYKKQEATSTEHGES